MKRRPLITASCINIAILSLVTTPFALTALEIPYRSHERTRPQPKAVTPGLASTQEKAGTAPSDAIVLFDGTNLDAWVAVDGSPTAWTTENGTLVCVPDSGYIRTLQSFGDCQLHIEWASPIPVQGSSQGRGNSGVFFGMTRYEVQVLDSFENPTYADGSAGSIYGQYPPAVNATLPSGQWQTYDILYTAPRFDREGNLASRARLTVLHNGVVIQNDRELTGPTVWIGRPPYKAHPVKLPIALQDHGNPVRFRNIWVRELDENAKPEYYLPEGMLDSYVGTYESSWGAKATVSRMDSGRLKLEFGGAVNTLYASGIHQFFDKITDVTAEFRVEGPEKVALISVGEGPMTFKRLK